MRAPDTSPAHKQGCRRREDSGILCGMTSSARGQFDIRPAAPGQETEGVRLLLPAGKSSGSDIQVNRMCRAFASGALPVAGLLQAWRSERLVGVVFVQLQPGKTATVWIPRLMEGEPEESAGRLLAAAAETAKKQGVRVAQALLPEGDSPDATRFAEAGFQPVADLDFLVASTQSVSQPAVDPLTFEPFSETKRTRLTRLVDRTYERTLDCATLDGLRDVDDILAGYQATGQFDPARWLLVRYRRRDVGCLLLADHPESDHWELVYMGLVPEVRGRGFGLKVTRYAQWLAHAADRSSLVLAVDANNWPAQAVYSSAGFVRSDRRSAFLRVFEQFLDQCNEKTDGNTAGQATNPRM